MAQILMSNPQDAYRKQNILTASPVDLIIMLYDGLKKNILLAKRAINAKNMDSAHKYLIKSQDIVAELINCLDMSFSISSELLSLYEFMLHTLEEINVTKNDEKIEPLLDIIGELRDTWKSVSESQKGSLSLGENLG